jgi:amino acid transporter
VAGGFYVVVIIAQTLGFGTDAAGVKAFGSSSSPLGDLSKGYVGSALSDLINFGAMISAFASGLGTAAAGSRILFALGRDGFGSSRLGQASERTGAPAGALSVVMVIAVIVIVTQRAVGTNAANAFFYPGTIGVLSLLVAYIVTNVGALRYLFGRVRRAPMWQAAIPVIAIAFLGYTIYKNVKGAAFPYDRFPYVVAIWLLVGLTIVVAMPGLARRIGAGLAREEGIAAAESEPPATRPGP